jgi:arylsulfatase A-like enzyme
VLILSGPGIRAGVRLNGARLVDLAPTILHLLDIAPPAELEGRVLEEALVDSDVTRSPRPIDDHFAPPPGEHDYSPEEAEKIAEIAEHLRSLGYF